MPDDQDIEELKKIYLDEIGNDGAKDIPNEDEESRNNFNFNKKRIISKTVIIISVALLVFALGVLTERILFAPQRGNLPFKLEPNITFTDKFSQGETDSVEASVKLASSSLKDKLAFYVTVVPLDKTPPSTKKAIQFSQKLSRVESENNPKKYIRVDEKEILPFKKKIDLDPRQGRYAIQIGSYQNKERANALIDTLKKKGYHAYLVTTVIPKKGTFYRIRVGHYKTREEAEKYSSEMKQKDKISNYVTLASK